MTSIRDQLDGATNVLLKSSSMGGRDTCTSLLTEGVTNPNVLFVSFTRQPAACVDQLAETETGTVAVVVVGDTRGETNHEDVVTETISSPSDLTGLGIQIGEFLSEWSAPTVLCFDSLTSMLQYVDFETAYEFLHAITGQIHASDARAHFHIDPGAHDQQQIAGITSLFDASVSLEEEPRVRTRDVIE